MQEIAHAVTTQKLASKEKYREDYKSNVVGKPPHDPSQAFPEYNHMRKVTEATNQVKKPHILFLNEHFHEIYILQVNYKKEADNIRQHPQILADHPEFQRAKQAGKNASDVSNEK